MQLEEHRFHSPSLGNERSLWIRPPLNPSSPSHPLLLFLDGELCLQELGSEATLSRMEGEHRLPDSVAVFVSCIGPEERFAECPCNEAFARFVLDELLAWIEERYSA